MMILNFNEKLNLLSHIYEKKYKKKLFKRRSIRNNSKKKPIEFKYRTRTNIVFIKFNNY